MANSKVKIEILRDSTGAFYLIEDGKRRKIGIRELKQLREKKTGKKKNEKAEEWKRLAAIISTSY